MCQFRQDQIQCVPIHGQVGEESFYENTGIANESTTVGIGELNVTEVAVDQVSRQ